MKMLKSLTLILSLVAFVASTTFVQAEAAPAKEKKKAGCCEKAKAEGKTCEKCAKKKEDKK